MEPKFMVKWLFPILFIIIVFEMQVCNSCFEKERLGLLDLKAFFSFRFERGYNPLSTWVGPHCCNWERVKCNYGRVVELLIYGSYPPLQSTNLNVSLFQPFEELKTLNLDLHGFSGFTENKGFNEISSLKKLEILNLGRNNFNDSIFLYLSGLPSLKKLVLNWNLLMRSTPSYGSVNLNNLEYLDLNTNGLSERDGVIPFKDLRNLRELDLSNNDFTSTQQIKGFNEISKKLEILDIGGNYFDDSIFFNLSGSFPSLKKLMLSMNEMKHSTLSYGAINLRRLEFLDLSLNLRFDGIIPFKEMKNLRELDLRFNDFNGTLPLQGFGGFSSLKRLEILNLGSNHLNNSIFSSLSGLTSLQSLKLSSNDLKGSLPTYDISKLKSLQSLILRDNHYYKGAIPLQDLKNLRVLDLSQNKFSGSSLPIQGLCETNKLVQLDISDNNITGQFPQCIQNFTKLTQLDISRNQFSGNISSSVISNLTSLEYLLLEGNNFEGLFLFSSLANLSKLKVLELSGSDDGKLVVETEKPHKWLPTFQLEVLTLRNCNLNRQISTSQIPSFLLTQHDLRLIDLSYNQLVGTFPLWLLQNNSKLSTVVLNDNSLGGTLELPTWILELSWLQISNNIFSGSLPDNMGFLLPKVYYLNVSSNSFEGKLPSSMQEMKWLQILDLSNNKFSGNFNFSQFTGISYLATLFLANNNFSGDIEDGPKDSFSLVAFDISNNMISGKVPSWIIQFSNLQYLKLSRNRFQGELPPEICSCHQLIFFDVSQNQLYGHVPSCLNSPSLLYLYMQENYLSGPIPHALAKSSQLKVVDLSYNKFSGHISSWINRLTSLRALLLKRNELRGPIPQQLCQVREISILDVSSNKFNGSIPLCLNNISFGVVNDSEYAIIQVGRFQIVDGLATPSAISYATNHDSFMLPNTIFNPEWKIEVDFTTKSRSETYEGNILNFMSGLDLSENELTGHIPPQIGDLLHIRALNFSHNKLVGFIPETISNLKQLESLDLSHNLLSGKIPPQFGELNALGTFNVSYNNLSGMIPTSPHFQTYPESSYFGNFDLCGQFIRKKCSNPVTPSESQIVESKEEDGRMIDMEALYWSFGVSYVIALLGIAIILYINPQWREAWFYFAHLHCPYVVGKYF